MPACNDVYIGGTVSGSTISGGTSITEPGKQIQDYGPLWAVPGYKTTARNVLGTPGTVIPANRLPNSRRGLLSMAYRNLDANGFESAGAIDTNQAAVHAIVDNPDGFLIEWQRSDGVNLWVQAYNLFQATEAMVRRTRFEQIPYESPWPSWQSETEYTDTVNGAGQSLSIGGDVSRIYNPTLVFAGDGYFEDDTSGLRVTISGSGSPVTVSRDATTGRWRVLESGSDAPGLATWNDRRVMYLTKGGTFTSTVSVGVTWRRQYA